MARKRKSNGGTKKKASSREPNPAAREGSAGGLWVDTLALQRMRRVTNPPYGPKPILSKNRFLELADIALGGMDGFRPKKKPPTDREKK